jgi:ankyrin repeat protein
MVCLVRLGFVNPDDSPIKQLICYFFFGVMAMVFILVLMLLGSGFAGGCKAEFCQFAKISFLIWNVIAAIVMPVLGKFVLVHHKDPFSIGILLGFFVVMSYNMLGSGVLFSAKLPNKVWMPFIYGGAARPNINHETDDAFAAFSFFLCILYSLFTWILFNWRYVLTFEGQTELEFQDLEGSDKTLLIANHPAGAKKGRLSDPKYARVVSLIVDDNDGGLQQWLKDSNTHINDTSEDKDQTAVMFACRHGAVNCALLLLSSGANTNLKMNAAGGGGAALYICAQTGNEQIMEFLIRFHANLNACISTGATPCFIAAKKAHLGCLRMLVDAGADVNASTRGGSGPLHMAAYHGNMKELHFLLKTRAVVDLTMKGEITALFLAVQQGHANAAQALMLNGADVNYARTIGDTCLFVATHHEQIDMLKLLLSQKANPNHVGPDGGSAVHLAVEHGNTVCLEMLLNAKADPNTKMVDGATPLFIAAQDRHGKVTPAVIDMLCRFDAHVDEARGDQTTPYQIAMQKGHTELAEALQRQGASTIMPAVVSKNPHRNSALAAEYGKRTVSIDFNRSQGGGLAMIRGMSTWSSRSDTVTSDTAGDNSTFSALNPLGGGGGKAKTPLSPSRLLGDSSGGGKAKPKPPPMQSWSSAKEDAEVAGAESGAQSAASDGFKRGQIVSQTSGEEVGTGLQVNTVTQTHTLKKKNTHVVVSRTTAEI